MRLWCHLVSLKRAGRGHDPTGAGGTEQGELAVDCPACPHLGRNILNDWEQSPKNVKYVIHFHSRFRVISNLYPNQMDLHAVFDDRC